MSEPTRDDFEGWAVVELLGHRKLVGYVGPASVAGAAMIRIDVPGRDGEILASPLYNPAALYGLTPITEETARALAGSHPPDPVTRWELPARFGEAASRPRCVELEHQDEDGDHDG